MDKGGYCFFTSAVVILFQRKRCRNLLTFQNNNIKLKSEHVFDTNHERGITTMTDNEKELINIIRENDNPSYALMTAILIVSGYLKQHGSSEEQAAAVPRELA